MTKKEGKKMNFRYGQTEIKISKKLKSALFFWSPIKDIKLEYYFRSFGDHFFFFKGGRGE